MNHTETESKTEKLTEDQLRQIQECVICKKKVGHTGDLYFYRITLEQVLLDVKALRQNKAMCEFFDGNVALGNIFSPTQHYAAAIQLIQVGVCSDCIIKGELVKIIGAAEARG